MFSLERHNSNLSAENEALKRMVNDNQSLRYGGREERANNISIDERRNIHAQEMSPYRHETTQKDMIKHRSLSKQGRDTAGNMNGILTNATSNHSQVQIGLKNQNTRDAIADYNSIANHKSTTNPT